MQIPRKFRLLLALVVPALAIAGCNTVKGIGQDLEKGGEAVQKASDGASK
jgi:entericidin B